MTPLPALTVSRVGRVSQPGVRKRRLSPPGAGLRLGEVSS